MSDRFLKTLLKAVKKESKRFAKQFVVASRGGAEVAAKQILEAAANQNQPSDVMIEKIVNALKAGVNLTGQQMMTAGLDLMKGVGSSDTSKSAESSQSTDSFDTAGSNQDETMSAAADRGAEAVSFGETSKRSDSKDM